MNNPIEHKEQTLTIQTEHPVTHQPITLVHGFNNRLAGLTALTRVVWSDAAAGNEATHGRVNSVTLEGSGRPPITVNPHHLQ